MIIQKQPDYLIFADSAKKGENAEFPDISRGWGITIEQTASKPPMEWMNGAFNRVDKNILYLLQQGVPEWNEKVTYPVNAIIKYNGVLYTSIAENDNARPSTNTTKWKKTQAEIPIASTTQKGIVQLNSAIDSDSQVEAATPLAVKIVNNNANEAHKNIQVLGGRISDADYKATIANDNAISANNNANEAHKNIQTLGGRVSTVENQVVIANDNAILANNNANEAHKNIQTLGGRVSTIEDKFTCSGIESRVYSHDKRFYLFVNDDGIVAMFNTVSNKMAWGFTENGILGEGYVPADRILNLDQFVRDRSVPVGVPMPWPQAIPPAGWFECNGAPIDKNRFPKLAAAYPSGFLPDLRGEFIRGWDAGRGVDSGRGILSWQNHQLTAHRHVGGWGESLTSLNAENRQRTAPFGCTGETGSWVGATGNDNDNPLFYTNDGTNGSRTNSKGTTSWFDLNPNGLVGNETRPRNVAFMYIVKAE